MAAQQSNGSSKLIGDQFGNFDTAAVAAATATATTPNNVQRDKLTNMPLDDKGRYSQTVVLDGKAYEAKYLPYATAQCIAGGQNLDMSDPVPSKVIQEKLNALTKPNQ